MDTRGGSEFRPNMVHGDFTKPPAALAPLRARTQWVIWRLIWTGDRWTKPPFRCDDPQRHASSADPVSWSTYDVAVAAAAAGDGISYMLQPEDPFAPVDIDHVRDPVTGTIEGWAQRLLDQASHTYTEISPSGTGLRIWGTAEGSELHRKFALENGAALELFRRTRKALTVTGLQLGSTQQLGNIDALLDRAVVWAQQHQQKQPRQPSMSAGTTSQYSIDQIEQIVQHGAPDGGNRSDTFHTIIGHYLGCGWDEAQIFALLDQYPDGIGGRYRAEGRLEREVRRSIDNYRSSDGSTESWTNGWHPTTEEESPQQEPRQEQTEEPQPEPEQPEPMLPPMHCHGDPDPRPIKDWTIKDLVPRQGHGLLAGQWATFKSFIGLDLASSVMTSRAFIGHTVKRQAGVLFLAAEGQHEMRVRLSALVQEKCGNVPRAPFRWYEEVPVLLSPDGLKLLVAMGKQAAASLQQEFGLPLGLVIIDTVAASAGYSEPGAESDSAIGQRLMNVLKLAGMQLDCFMLGIDHFGKDINAGTRGSSAKESSSDLVLACLGNRELSGRMLNLRLAVRKCRGGKQGHEYPFGVREVTLPELDEDGDPVTTLVIDWSNPGPRSAALGQDPWEQENRTNSRQAMLLLKRILMAKLAESGTTIELDGTSMRAIDQELVRGEFYAQTPADGTDKQKRDVRRLRFTRAIDRAVEKQLICIREIGGTMFIWLMAKEAGDEEF